MPIVLEECGKIKGVDVSLVVLVNSSECCIGRVVISHFQVSLQNLLSSMEVEFSLKQLGESKLDVSWKIVISAYSETWSLLSDSSQKIILTRKNDLLEVGEGKSAVLI